MSLNTFINGSNDMVVHIDHVPLKVEIISNGVTFYTSVKIVYLPRVSTDKHYDQIIITYYDPLGEQIDRIILSKSPHSNHVGIQSDSEF